MSAETTTANIPAKWTPDCQGKWDFDGSLVTLSTRYWPRGGGFTLMRRNGAQVTVENNDARPEIRPHAHATIYLGNTANDFYDDAVELADREFEGDTEAEVKAQVERWAGEMFKLIGQVLTTALQHQRGAGA
jgi:hypothetical protein